MTDLAYQNSRLFQNISPDEIGQLIHCSGARIETYQKQEMIFDQYDKPNYMYVLVSGVVSVGKYFMDGKQSYMTTFENPGDIFGEVLLFLNKPQYDFFAVAQAETKVLLMPRNFLMSQCGKACGFHAQLTDNLLSIFAQKAYFLQTRVQILSGSSLRARIAGALLMTKGSEIKMSREEFAGFVNATRPSLSRELSNMENDGLIAIDHRVIRILDRKRLEEYVR